MTELEHSVLGGAFALCAGILFCGAVPLYVLRHGSPGAPPPLPTGRVGVAAFGLVDVIGVSLFFGWYTLLWWASKSVTTDLGELDGLAGRLLQNLVFQGLMVLAVVAFLSWRANLAEVWGLHWRRWPLLFLLVPAVLIIMYGTNAILLVSGYHEWVAGLTGQDPEEPAQDTVRLFSESSDWVVIGLMSIVACFGAPVAEEVVFRGYIYPAVKRFSNIGVGVLFSGIFFGAVHLNLSAFLPLVILGCLLALVYEMTGSLWMPLAVHFSFNAITVVIQLLAKAFPDALSSPSTHGVLIGLW